VHRQFRCCGIEGIPSAIYSGSVADYIREAQKGAARKIDKPKKTDGRQLFADILGIMPIKKRFIIIMILMTMALVAYGLAKFYSPSLVYYVVEQTLLEKAPPGMNRNRLRHDFSVLISSAPDQNAKMEKLFRVSAYLEKIQKLTPVQLDEVMRTAVPKSQISPVLPIFYRNWNFFYFQDV
jgi:hypothetical protein